MTLTIAATAFAILTLSTHTDTTLTVSPGTRLAVNDFGGSVSVATWTRNAVRIEAEHSSRTRIEVEEDESELAVKASGRMGVPTSVDFTITVPVWMALEISGVDTDVQVEGTRADVKVETVGGEVHVTGGKGFISLQSVQGDVVLERSSGHAELSSINAGVRVIDHDGEASVETVNGDVWLEHLHSGDAEASTVNGSIVCAGDIREAGRYRFSTHDGDIVVVLPAAPNAAVSVKTYSGDFDSSFPVTLNEAKRGRRFKFNLGSGAGGATLELESFQGSIRLLKAGDPEIARLREAGLNSSDEDRDDADSDSKADHKHDAKSDTPDRTDKDKNHDDDDDEETP